LWIRRRNCTGIKAETSLQAKVGSEAQLMTSQEAEWDAKARGPHRDKQKKCGVRIFKRQCSALTETRTSHQITNTRKRKRGNVVMRKIACKGKNQQ
jgi:hypothetical protein